MKSNSEPHRLSVAAVVIGLAFAVLLAATGCSGSRFGQIDESTVRVELRVTPAPVPTEIPSPTATPLPVATPVPTAAPPVPTPTALPAATPTATPQPVELEPGVYLTQDGDPVDQWIRSSAGSTEPSALVDELRTSQTGPFDDLDADESDSVVIDSIRHVLTTETQLGVVRTITWTEQNTPTHSLHCYAVIDLQPSASCTANGSANRLDQHFGGLPDGIGVFNAHPLAQYMVVETESGVSIGGPVHNATAVLHIDRRWGEATNVYLSDRFGQPVRHWWIDETQHAHDGKREDFLLTDLGPGEDIVKPDGAPAGDIFVTFDTTAEASPRPVAALELAITPMFTDATIRPIFDEVPFVGTLQWDLEAIDVYSLRAEYDPGPDATSALVGCVIYLGVATKTWSCNGVHIMDGVAVERAPDNSLTRTSGNGRLELELSNPDPASKWLVIDTFDGFTIVAQANEHVALAIWREIYGLPEQYQLLDANLEILLIETV